MEKTELRQLVIKAKQGDQEAFAALYAESFNNAYYTARKILRNEDSAQEVTQDVFLIAYRDLGKLETPESFFKWVQQITAFQCTNRMKKKTEVLFAPVGDDADSTLPDVEDDNGDQPDAVLEREDIKQLILRIVDSLPDQQRAVVLMYYYQELTIQQISEVTGTNENTIKSQLNYARKKIKAGVEKEEEKSGVRLHSISAIALFGIFAKDALATAPSLTTQSAILQSITQAAAGTIAATTGTAAAGTGTATATGMTLTAKIAIGVASAVLAGGIGTGIFLATRPSEEPAPPPSSIVQSIPAPASSSVSQPPQRDPRLSERPALDFTMTLPHEAEAGFDDLALLEQIAGAPEYTVPLLPNVDEPAYIGWQWETFNYGVTFYSNPHTGEDSPEASELDYTRAYGPEDEYRWLTIYSDRYSVFGIDLGMNYEQMKAAMEATFESGVFDLSRSGIYDDEPDVYLSYELYFPGQDEMLELYIEFGTDNIHGKPAIVARRNYEPFLEARRNG
ncbi:RNA polymerase sigma factor [Ruminococcaceae bacterium OttesenSCG-928-D13]|nr:RNA polymerase sigma factor [Ruminococcaceae bacterium OttesenSCG-928-D13]